MSFPFLINIGSIEKSGVEQFSEETTGYNWKRGFTHLLINGQLDPESLRRNDINVHGNMMEREGNRHRDPFVEQYLDETIEEMKWALESLYGVGTVGYEQIGSTSKETYRRRVCAA